MPSVCLLDKLLQVQTQPLVFLRVAHQSRHIQLVFFELLQFLLYLVFPFLPQRLLSLDFYSPLGNQFLVEKVLAILDCLFCDFRQAGLNVLFIYI